MIKLDPSFVPTSTITVEAPKEMTAIEEAAKPGVALEEKTSTDTHVDLSTTGRILSKSTQSKYADIDKSDLPDLIKEALKRIREIREELEKKLQELQAAMSDKKLTEDQRKARIQGLQSEVATLSAALTDASAALTELMSESELTPEQAVTVGKYLMG